MNFLNSLLVAGAAAAAIPILIHLFQRRKVQKVVFGAVRFLKATAQRVIHRHRYAEMVLTALRALALALLALAFARPFLLPPDGRDDDKDVRSGEAVLVLVDNSGSMRANGRLDRARKEALGFLDGLRADAAVGVGEFSSSFKLLAPVGSDIAEAKKAVESIEPSMRGTDLNMAFEQADRILSDRPEEHSRVVLVSDLQETSWKERVDWQLSGDTEIDVHNVGKEDIANVSVGRIIVPELVVAGGFTEIISTRVRNLTNKPLTNCLVQFEVAGKVVEQRRISAEAGADIAVRFPYVFKEEGDITGRITVDAPDAIPDDNVGHFSVHVTPRVRVLLVNGDPAVSLAGNDGFFLKMALMPDVAGHVSPFTVKEVSVGGFAPGMLKEADCVVLANVGRLSGAKRDAIRAYVVSGGGVLFTCGSRMDVDSFNLDMEGLAPCGLWKTALRSDQEPVILNRLEMTHEVFAPFAKPRSGDLSVARFKQYMLVKDSQAAAVIARFDNGHPALIEKQVGKGRSMLYTSSFDLDWNDLCIRSVFPAFAHQLVRRLYSRPAEAPRNVVVGDRVTLRLAGEVAAAELRPPQGDASPLELNRIGEVQMTSFTTEAPGIHEILYGDTTARFAAGLAPGEADYRRIDERLLVASIAPDKELARARVSGAALIVAKATARERAEDRQRIWVYLAGAVLFLLLAEMALADRIGTV